MVVTFAANVASRLEIHIFDYEKEVNVPFTFTRDATLERAVFRTSDKKQIKMLLSHPHVSNGQITMDYPEEAIAAYLTDDNRKGRFTPDSIDTVSDKAAIALAEHYKIRFTEPALIRSALVNKPVTRFAEEIMQKYPTQTTDIRTEEDILHDMLKNKILSKRGKTYFEVATETPVGVHAAALEWAKHNEEKLTVAIE